MSEHVFAWVAGFGWTLMPYAPFRFERVSGNPKSVRVEHTGPSGSKQVVVSVSEKGAQVHSGSSPSQATIGDVVELIEGAAFPHWEHAAAHDHWRIESSVLSVGWPEGFAIRSVADAPPAFELAGPDNALIWVQGPAPMSALPTFDQMVGPGQTIVRTFESTGGAMLELQYVHDGSIWHMFHCVVDRYAGAFCVVTGQTPAKWREWVQAAVEEVAVSLTPCAPE